MFLDQGLARKFHFLKLTSNRTDSSIYIEITRTSDNLSFDAKERLKAYKKNFRDEFEAYEETVSKMIADFGMELASMHIESSISLSLAARQQVLIFAEQIDQWPHGDEIIQRGVKQTFLPKIESTVVSPYSH